MTAAEQTQKAETRYRTALHNYTSAVKTITAPETLDRLKTELCNAFAELRAAHDVLSKG